MQIKQFSIADGKTTPATHVFTPFSAQRSDSPATWYNKETSSPIGYRRITASVVERANGGYKAVIKISDPVLAIIDGNCCVDANTPKVSYTDIAELSFVIPAGATTDNRKDILAYAKNFLGTDIAQNLVIDLEPQF